MNKNKDLSQKTFLIITQSHVLYDEGREIDRIEIGISEEDFDKKEIIAMIKKKYKPQKFSPGTHWFIKLLTYLGEAQAPVIDRFYLESYTEREVNKNGHIKKVKLLNKTSGYYNF